MKHRLDELLALKQLCKSRSQAKLLIEAGSVTVNGKIADKPAQNYPENAKIELLDRQKFVGRGAYKIKAAIETFNIPVKNKVIADIGASTGGFSDYLLRQGAKTIYAIDVGHDQLDPELKKDPRLINLEKTDIRQNPKLPQKVDLAVADLSHISLRLTIESIFKLCKKAADVICLFKPQFELGPKMLGKKGLVKSTEQAEEALKNFLEYCEETGYRVIQTMPSPIQGKEGNTEYLIHFKN